MEKVLTKKYKYQAFGLVFESEFLLLNLLSSEKKADIEILLEKTPQNIKTPERKGVLFEASQNELLLKVNNIANYYVKDGKKIIIEKHNSSSNKEVELFLMGPVLGALFHQRGILPIHGSAIKINNFCIIISGVSGVGKSTLAAAFLKKKYKILADDISIINFILKTSR